MLQVLKYIYYLYPEGILLIFQPEIATVWFMMLVRIEMDQMERLAVAAWIIHVFPNAENLA